MRPDRYILGREEGFLGDLRDQQFVSEFIEDVDPEIVVHLEAVTVAYSHDYPHEVFEVNVTGTMNLTCLHGLKVKQFIFAGCFDEKSRIYTVNEGFKTIMNLKLP